MEIVIRRLRRGEAVAILMDQNVGWRKGVFVDFFGHRACTNKGMALLALETGAAVVPTFGWRKQDDSHSVQLSPAVPLIDTGDREKDILANTARYTKIIEEAVRAHPSQWFWLHKRWKSRPPSEQGG